MGGANAWKALGGVWSMEEEAIIDGICDSLHDIGYDDCCMQVSNI